MAIRFSEVPSWESNPGISAIHTPQPAFFKLVHSASFNEFSPKKEFMPTKKGPEYYG